MQNNYKQCKTMQMQTHILQKQNVSDIMQIKWVQIDKEKRENDADWKNIEKV